MPKAPKRYTPSRPPRPAEQTKEQSKAFFNSTAWKRLRQEALVRDLYACQDCGVIQGQGLQGHHIQARDERPDLALELSNVIMLCHACHNKREFREGRRF
jgi:5-methylcytosine-specific restriction protein A